MIEFVLPILIWYSLGVIGSFLGTVHDLSNGQDFTVRDLVMCAFISLFGLVAFAIGLTAYLSIPNDSSKVLVKGKRK